MVTGSGDIAFVLPDRDDLVFFASGVSNSQEERESEYKRERDLLLNQRRDRKLVYFSSLGVLDRNSRYFQHKRDMEAMVKANFPDYCIIRIGNITWGNNPHTLINYLKAHPNAPIRDEYRYIIDKAELLHWVNKIPEWNVEMNITGQRMSIKDIVKEYVHEEPLRPAKIL